MPRIFLAAMTAIFIALSAYGGAVPKMAIALNLGPTFQTMFNRGGLGIGALAEFAFLDNFSAVIHFSYASYRTAEAGDVTQLSPCIQLRWYPMTEAAGGFWLAPRYQYSIITANSSARGVSFAVLDAGYKILLNRGPGLLIEPYLGYGLAFDSTVIGGLDYGISIGYAF
jgi:hypothetical protein